MDVARPVACWQMRSSLLRSYCLCTCSFRIPMKAVLPLNFAFIMSFLLRSIRLAVNSSVKAFLPSGGGFRKPSRLGFYTFPSNHPTCLQSATAGDVSSSAPESSEFVVTLSVSSAEDLEEIGALLAILSSPPDVVFLDGGTSPAARMQLWTCMRLD
jgi:hypothetical protein